MGFRAVQMGLEGFTVVDRVIKWFKGGLEVFRWVYRCSDRFREV